MSLCLVIAFAIATVFAQAVPHTWRSQSQPGWLCDSNRIRVHVLDRCGIFAIAIAALSLTDYIANTSQQLNPEMCIRVSNSHRAATVAESFARLERCVRLSLGRDHPRASRGIDLFNIRWPIVSASQRLVQRIRRRTSLPTRVQSPIGFALIAAGLYEIWFPEFEGPTSRAAMATQ